MKHRTHKPTAKAVAAILCAALMLTACGSKETANTETTSVTATEATSVESTEMTTTEAAVAEPTTEPAVKPAETPTESGNSSYRDCSCRRTHNSTRRNHCCKHRIYLFRTEPDHVCKVRSKCQRPAQHGW